MSKKLACSLCGSTRTRTLTDAGGFVVCTNGVQCDRRVEARRRADLVKNDVAGVQCMATRGRSTLYFCTRPRGHRGEHLDTRGRWS